jgi:hypothetical protein
MPFRPPVPSVADLVAWPADFGTRFTVFVDAEEEFDWRRPLSRDDRSVETIGALPTAGARFAGWGVPLTLMVDHPVATDLRAIEAIGPMLTRGTTVGTQLHPWVNPPFDEAVTPPNSFVGNLPRDLEAAKLDVLTRAIVEAFGERPLAYRAGRYGIGPATFELLAERGYRLDSSIRSRFDYSGEGGPDFSAVGNHAWRAGGMIELPLTTVFTGVARGRGIGLYRAGGRVPRGRGVLARAHLLSRVPLTPEGVPIGEAIEAVRIAAGEGVRVLNFAFHSPSLVPGNTPFVRNEGDLAAFWAWWERMVAELDRLNIRPASLSELIAAAA